MTAQEYLKKYAGPTEHDEQVKIVEWVNDNLERYPDLCMFFANPNGGLRHKATAGQLKAEGVRSGIPDLFLDAPRGPYHGLRIELKKDKKSYPSKTQKVWLKNLNERGYYADVCRGSAEVIETIIAYLSL